MAVFTELNQRDIESLLSQYDVGKLVGFAAISEGIENTNYFVDTSKDGEVMHWVLTLFENLDDAELPYFTVLTRHLADRDFQVPAPEPMSSGDTLFTVHARKGVLVPKLTGKSHANPSDQECLQAGEWLAQMHLALITLEEKRPLSRDLVWMGTAAERLRSYLPDAEFRDLHAYIERYRSYQSDLLLCPQGTVHGDLFRDNVLFEDGEISGVIDFYHACYATLLFDLAVVANDWCAKHDQSEPDARYDKKKLAALISGYQRIREWTDAEQGNWANCLELAALRFWISRLQSKYLPGYQQASVSGQTIKDPNEMKRLLPEL